MLRQNYSDSRCIFSSKFSHPYIYSRPFIFFKIQEYFTYPPELGGGYCPSYISRYKYITFVYPPQTWKICDSKTSRFLWYGLPYFPWKTFWKHTHTGRYVLVCTNRGIPQFNAQNFTLSTQGNQGMLHKRIYIFGVEK